MLFAVTTVLAAASVAPAEKTPAAARAVVERYYAAIAHRDFGRAYRLWSDNGRASGKTLDGFTRGFTQTADTRVFTAPPVNGDAAAGSVFVTVPVRVEARLKSGLRQRFAGRYVLRRVNDVPGATAEQLRWHIMSARLTPIR